MITALINALAILAAWPYFSPIFGFIISISGALLGLIVDSSLLGAVFTVLLIAISFQVLAISITNVVAGALAGFLAFYIGLYSSGLAAFLTEKTPHGCILQNRETPALCTYIEAPHPDTIQSGK